MTAIGVITYNQGNMKKDDKACDNVKIMLDDIGKTDAIVLCLQESNSDVIVDCITELRKDTHEKVYEDYKYQGLLGKLKLVMWLTKNIAKGYKPVIKDSIKCDGVLGWLFFTKGGLYVELPINDKKIIFYNVHLPSHAAQPDKRNKCLMKIINHEKNTEKHIKIVAGDMNYRTSDKQETEDEHRPSIAAAKCCTGNKCPMKTWKSDDQLKEYLKTQNKLREADIEFCETCRFLENDKGRHYDGKRYQSWCDRILYTDGAKVALYKSIDLSIQSDHYAVYARLIV